MDDEYGSAVGLSSGPDHGYGQLGRVADTLLTALDRAEPQPQIAMVYNILAEPPGPASYAVLALEDEMWSLAPSQADTFALLVHLAGNAQRWDPTQVCRSPRHRPDGIVMIYRAMLADTSTAAGRAIVANLAEGFYRHGDVGASPVARSAYCATALDRADATVRLVKLGLEAPVADLGTAFGAPASARVEAAGGTETGLGQLLAAMHARWHRLAHP